MLTFSSLSVVQFWDVGEKEIIRMGIIAYRPVVVATETLDADTCGAQTHGIRDLASSSLQTVDCEASLIGR